MAKYNYRRDDLWTCTQCGDEQGRHDQYFDGVCEKCNTENEEEAQCKKEQVKLKTD